MLIYKIFRQSEWTELAEHGQTAGSPADLQDGFVHFSTAEQCEATRARHFAGEKELILAAVDVSTLGSDLRWEVSRDGRSFPHLYRKLTDREIVWHRPLAPDSTCDCLAP